MDSHRTTTLLEHTTAGSLLNGIVEASLCPLMRPACALSVTKHKLREISWMQKTSQKVNPPELTYPDSDVSKLIQ